MPVHKKYLPGPGIQPIFNERLNTPYKIMKLPTLLRTCLPPLCKQNTSVSTFNVAGQLKSSWRMMKITGLKISKFLREMRRARSANIGNANFELTVGKKT
jgi:hypothetical protein